MKLQIVIEENCLFCPEAIALGKEVRNRFPDLEVEVLDLAKEGTPRPEAVFAVPTFLLEGQVIFLGNPSAQRLFERIETWQRSSAKEKGA